MSGSCEGRAVEGMSREGLDSLEESRSASSLRTRYASNMEHTRLVNMGSASFGSRPYSFNCSRAASRSASVSGVDCSSSPSCSRCGSMQIFWRSEVSLSKRRVTSASFAATTCQLVPCSARTPPQRAHTWPRQYGRRGFGRRSLRRFHVEHCGIGTEECNIRSGQLPMLMFEVVRGVQRL